MQDSPVASLQEKIQQLKKVRQKLGWSEEKCAHFLGVTYGTLNRWERGESLPRSEVILRAIDQFIADNSERPDLGGRVAP